MVPSMGGLPGRGEGKGSLISLQMSEQLPIEMRGAEVAS